jgi:ABC-type nitrate/sulfonate/bicarbonate transport system substrate-binding protein
MKIAPLLGWLIFILALGLTAQRAPAQETMRVAIPLFPTAAFPVLVANDKGFFQKEGLTVEPIRINSAPTTYQALISSDVHVAAGAPTGLLPSHLQGADIIALGSWLDPRPAPIQDETLIRACLLTARRTLVSDSRHHK